MYTILEANGNARSLGKDANMKKDLGSASELFPQSVFIVGSYDEAGVPNAMNVA